MSAILNPIPQQTPPQAPAPAPVPETGQGGSNLGRVIFWLALVGAAGAAAWWLATRPNADTGVAQVVKTAVATQGPLEIRIRIGGTTSARDYANITVPRMMGPEGNRPLMLLSLAKGGKLVKNGEQVASIDGQTLADHIDDIHSTVLQAESDVTKRRAEQMIDTENVMQSLRVARSQLDKAKLDAQAAEVRTTIDRELMKLAVEEAQATYEEQNSDLKFREISQKADLRILQYTTERHTRHRDRHKKDLQRFNLTAPMPGLIVLQSTMMGGEFRQIQDGDQVYSGQSIMKIVSPNSMQVEANVSQADIDMFRVGQTASIGIDAFPGLNLKGKIYAIGAIAVSPTRQQNYIRNVPVRVVVETIDPRVIPDLSAYADVLIGKHENQLLVPRAAVQEENGKSVVWVKQGQNFAKREVQLGKSNYTHVAIAGGLNAGDEVALNYAPPKPDSDSPKQVASN